MLTITSVAQLGPHFDDFAFTVSPALPVALQPGQVIVLSVRFTPRAVGARAGSLMVYDNAINSPQTIPLAGNGILPADLGVTMSAATTFVSLLSGSTLTYTIRLVNLSPNTAYNAVLSTFVPAGTTFSSVRSTLGQCELSEQYSRSRRRGRSPAVSARSADQAWLRLR